MSSADRLAEDPEISPRDPISLFSKLENLPEEAKCQTSKDKKMLIDRCPPETWPIIARAAGGPATARCRMTCKWLCHTIDTHADFNWRLVRLYRMTDKCYISAVTMKEPLNEDVEQHLRKLASVVAVRDFTLASTYFSHMIFPLPSRLVFAILDPPLFVTDDDPKRSVRRDLNADGILYEIFEAMKLGKEHERAFFGDMIPQRERKSILSQYSSESAPIGEESVFSQMTPMQLACMMGNHVQFQEELDHHCITRGAKNAFLDLNRSIHIFGEAKYKSSKSNCFTLSSFIGMGGSVECAKIMYEFVQKHQSPPLGPMDVFLQLFAPSAYGVDTPCIEPLHIAVVMNRTELVKWILTMEPELLHQKDHDGVRSTLDYVGTYANVHTAEAVFDTMQLALPPGASSKDPFHGPISTLIQKFLHANNMRVILWIAERLNITCMELLLAHPIYVFKAVQSRGRDCLSMGLKGATPQQIAQISELWTDDPVMLSQGLQCGGVLLLSAVSSNVPKWKLLVDAGVRFRGSCPRESPLFYLIQNIKGSSEREMLKHYLATGAVTREEVNIEERCGGAIFFLLSVARTFQQDDAKHAANVMMRLLDIVCPTGNQALPSQKNMSLISCTLEMREFVFTQLLLERGVRLERDSLLWVAKRLGRDRDSALRFRTLLEHGCPPNVTSQKDGSTPLHVLAGFGTFGVKQCMRILVEAGADVHARDINGFTPLMCSVRSGKKISVTTLLDLGADVCARDARGENLLHMMCRAVTCEWLDTTPQITKDVFGIIPYMVDYCKGKYVPQMKAMFLEENYEGKTPIDYLFLHEECFPHRKYRASFVSIMHRIGVDMNVLLRPNQETMLHKAVKIGDEAAIRALLEAGADKRIKDVRGVLPGSLTRNPQILLLL